MKMQIKKIIAVVLSVLMLVGTIPLFAAAANYEDPVFALTIVSDSDTQLVVTLDLRSGKFNCIDFGFLAKSGYTCTKLQRGTAFSSFVSACEDAGKNTPMCQFNATTMLVSFASTEVYNKSGAFIKATFSKSNKKAYAPGDIGVEFSNCAITSGEKSFLLHPILGFTLDAEELTLKYHQSYQINASVKGCTWTTSNSKVAIVNSDGVVHAGVKGTAVITATYGTTSVECRVTVKFNFFQSLLYYVAFGFLWMKPEKF